MIWIWGSIVAFLLVIIAILLFVCWGLGNIAGSFIKGWCEGNFPKRP